MPRQAVESSFKKRQSGTYSGSVNEMQLLLACTELNTSFAALVNHCAFTLRIFSQRDVSRLTKLTKAKAYENVGVENHKHVKAVIDEHSSLSTLDIEVGDWVLVVKSAGMDFCKESFTKVGWPGLADFFVLEATKVGLHK